MNNVIQQKIESIETINQRMNDVVEQTASLIVNEFAQFAEYPTSMQSTPTSSNNTWRLSAIGIVSGAAFLVGTAGWFACGSLWTKVLFWGGGIGLASDYVLNKNKKPTNQSPKDASMTNYSISTQRRFVSQKIMSTIDKINNLWENLTNTNKEQLLAFIENSTLSSNEKFNASSFVSVTKTLDFELLKMQNLIDEARSVTELKRNVSQIRIIIKDKIDTVTKSQIDCYRQVDKIMTGA